MGVNHSSRTLLGKIILAQNNVVREERMGERQSEKVREREGEGERVREREREGERERKREGGRE